MGDSIAVRNASCKESANEGTSIGAKIVFFETIEQSLLQRLIFGDAIHKGVLIVTRLVKWMLTSQHLKNNDSKGPHVNALAVSLTSCLFRSHVQYGSHYFVYIIMSMKHVCMYFCTKAKVSNFGNFQLAIKENVPRFDITVHNANGVEIGEARCRFLGVERQKSHGSAHFRQNVVKFGR